MKGSILQRVLAMELGEFRQGCRLQENDRLPLGPGEGRQANISVRGSSKTLRTLKHPRSALMLIYTKQLMNNLKYFSHRTELTPFRDFGLALNKAQGKLGAQPKQVVSFWDKAKL
jgi:hypothetical protein